LTNRHLPTHSHAHAGPYGIQLIAPRADRGIFITTSTFTRDAKDYVEGLETKVVLIDGVQVAELMFEYGVGVSTESTYIVKRIDNDFFEDEGGGDSVADPIAK
jgi:restriction system protein